ncbi:hypothetical protein ACQP10_38345 (plasmid) [Streptosporangium sandarakinum]|uniref:hypothetical protein n=1 Tax=Streptosporangium sandarakinum TaxID=1260955 RepID=UPI003D8EAD88
MAVTVARFRDALTDYIDDDPLPVMISNPYGSSAYPLTTRIEIGYFKSATSEFYDSSMIGRITTRPGDGTRVAVLITSRPKHDDHADHADIEKAATTSALAKALDNVAHIDPDMPVVVPLHDSALCAPLHPHLEVEYYGPDAEHYSGVWGLDPTDGIDVLALWPALHEESDEAPQDNEEDEPAEPEPVLADLSAILDGQGPVEICSSCGHWITECDGKWFHLINPALTGTDDHTAHPDDE